MYKEISYVDRSSQQLNLHEQQMNFRQPHLVTLIEIEVWSVITVAIECEWPITINKRTVHENLWILFFLT